ALSSLRHGLETTLTPPSPPLWRNATHETPNPRPLGERRPLSPAAAQGLHREPERAVHVPDNIPSRQSKADTGQPKDSQGAVRRAAPLDHLHGSVLPQAGWRAVHQGGRGGDWRHLPSRTPD